VCCPSLMCVFDVLCMVCVCLCVCVCVCLFCVCGVVSGNKGPLEHKV